MSALTLQNDLPGILGPMIDYPETAAALNAVADSLLNTDRHGLTRFERELIATYVSQLNGCEFCRESHAHFAAELYNRETLSDNGLAYVNRVLSNIVLEADDRTFELLLIAERASRFERVFVPEYYREYLGLTEGAIHDTILIAAAFNMFNRYVEAAGNPPPDDRIAYRDAARKIATHGYGR